MPSTLQHPPKAAPKDAALFSSTIIFWVAALLAGSWSWAAFARNRHMPTPLHVVAFLTGVAILLASKQWIKRTPQVDSRTTLPKMSSGLTIPYLACLLFVLFMPEYFLGQPVPLVRSAILLVGFAFLFYALAHIFSQREASPSPAHDQTARHWLIACCVVYFVLTTVLTLRKLYTFGYVGQDIAYFTQCLYTTLHGHLFYSNMYHDLLYDRPVTTDYAAHNQSVLFLFLPAYALFRSPATLLVFRNIFVVLCAWPLYLILRRFYSARTAVLGTVAFLIAPAVVYQTLYDFAPLSIVGFPLLFAFYYYLDGKRIQFCGWLVATQLVREDLVFVSFGFAALALLHKRSRGWIAFPGILGVFWTWLSWMVIFPHFLHGATSVVNSCFAQLGPDPRAIAYTIMRHPAVLMTRTNLVYAEQMIGPLGNILFLGSPACLIAMPYIVINLLGQGGACNTAMIYRHYALIPYVILFVAFVLSVHWFSARYSHTFEEREAIASSFMTFVLTTSLLMLVFVTGGDYFETLRSQPWHSEARQVAAMLPAHAAVAVPRYMLPTVAARAELYQSLRLLEYAHPDPDYVVIDKDWSRMAATSHWRPNYDLLRDNLANNSSFSVFYDSPNYVVYKKCAHCITNLPSLKAGRSE